MTPVVNPVWFYLMGLSTPILVLSAIVAIVALTIGLVYYLEGKQIEDKKEIHLGKKLIVVSALCGVMLVLTPTETTLTKMLIAQNVTYERVEVATDTVENVYQDIMQLFDKTDNDD